MKNLYLILLLQLACTLSFSQEKIQQYKSSEIVDGIVKMMNKDDFEGALRLFEQLSPNDSLYQSLQVSKSYCLLNASRFKEAEAFLKQNLKNQIHSDDRPSYYLNLLIALTNQNKYEEQLKTTKSALKEFPYNGTYFYYQANAYQELKQAEEALISIQRAISLHPSKSSYQFLAGDLYLEQGKMAEALMHYNIGLLFTENPAYLGKIEKLMSKKANTADVQLVKQMDDQRFEDLNLMMGNLVALSKKYKIEGKFDFAICKQNYLLYEAITGIEGEEKDWIDKYIDFHRWINENEYFVPFTISMLKSSDNEKIAAQVKKDQKAINTFLQEALIKLESSFEENIFLVEETSQAFKCYFENGKLRAFGEQFTKGGLQGDWYILEDGRLEEMGSFDESGNRIGYWESYHSNGKLDSRGYYKNGAYNKNFELFDINGLKKLELNYNEGVLDGPLINYKNGIVKEIKHFSEGKLDGEYINYFSNTDSLSSYKGRYKNDKAEGVHLYYHSNGALNISKEFENNLQTGIEKYYFPTGDLEYTIKVTEDKYDGSIISLNISGDTIQTGQYKAGDRVGEWRDYHPSGSLQSVYNYEKNILNGPYKDYHYNGQLIAEYSYKDGFIHSVSFWDKNGKLLYNKERKGRNLDYEGFNAEGKRTVKGTYNVKGGQEGLWTYFNPKNGQITEKINFKDGKKNGKSLFFNSFGQNIGYDNYEDGKLQGYSLRLYAEGQIKSALYYENDLAEGYHQIYYPNGKIKEINYYHKGQLNGISIFYAYEGWKASQMHYAMGEVNRLEIFDNNGNLVQDIDYSKITKKTHLERLNNQGILRFKEERIKSSDNGLTKMYFPNGQIQMQGEYINNKGEGLFTYYNHEGKLSGERHYVNNLLHGLIKNYYPNGNLKHSRPYQMNDLHGTTSYYSEEGLLETEKSYSYGKLHGPSVFYNSEEEKELIRDYEEGILVSYSYRQANGELSESIPVVDETLSLSIIDKNNILRRKINIVNGYFQGEYTQYFADGKLMERSNYINNEREGVYEEYYPSGLVKKEIQYKKGLLHGPSKEYYKNGALKSSYTYEYDLCIGEALLYTEDGKLKEKHIYENDTLQKIIEL